MVACRGSSGLLDCLAGAAKLLDATLMVVKLGIKQLVQSIHAVSFCLLDILHTAQYVLARLLEFGLVGTDFFLHSEVVSASLVQFGSAGIVG